MPAFSIMVSYDISAYRNVTVEADNLAAAVEWVRDDPDVWDFFAADYETAHNYRIIEVLDENDIILVEDIQISEPDGQTTLPAEVVLANLTASIISN
jgi:hypothetical protein